MTQEKGAKGVSLLMYNRETVDKHEEVIVLEKIEDDGSVTTSKLSFPMTPEKEGVYTKGERGLILAFKSLSKKSP